MKTRTLAAAMLMGLLVSACGGYYKVTDTSSGTTYYTKKVEDRPSGAVEFRDAVTGSTVLVRQSEVQEIDKDSFEAGTRDR